MLYKHTGYIDGEAAKVNVVQAYGLYRRLICDLEILLVLVLKRKKGDNSLWTNQG